MNNLAEIMKRKNITPIQLAETSGICVGNIRRLMKERTAIPYYKTAVKLSEALGYSVAQIRGEKEI